VILYRIWEEAAFGYESWAIQVNPQELDQTFWSNRSVKILDVHLEDYVNELQKRITDLKESRVVTTPASTAA
jgi:hypothetical protein